jgi:hypothetical protein
MPKHPNQGGGSNRQGPHVTKQAKRGPIIGSWSLNQGSNGSVKGTKPVGRPQKGSR